MHSIIYEQILLVAGGQDAILLSIEKQRAYARKPGTIQEVCKIQTKKAFIVGVALTSDKIYCALENRTVSVYDHAGKLIQNIIPPLGNLETSSIEFIKFDGVSVCFSCGAGIYSINNKEEATQTATFETKITFFQTLSDTEQIVQLQSKKVILKSQQTPDKILALRDDITSASLSPYITDLLMIGTTQGFVHLFDISANKLFETREISGHRLNSVQFSPSHQDMAMAASRDRFEVFRFGYQPMCIFAFEAESVSVMFDSENVLSFVKIGHNNVSLNLLSNSAPTIHHLSQIASHYTINVADKLECEVAAAIYRRDASAALNAVFDQAKQHLESGDVEKTEASFRLFDSCLGYLRRKKRSKIQLTNLVDDLVGSFAKIPDAMPDAFVVSPTVPDQLQHQQFGFVIKMRQLASKKQFVAGVYTSAIEFTKQNPNLVTPQFISAIIDMTAVNNKGTFTLQQLAIELIGSLKSGAQKASQRAISPSICCNHVIESNKVVDALLTASEYGRFNADPLDGDTLQKLYLNMCEENVFIPVDISYLTKIKQLRTEYITPDMMIEQLRYEDVGLNVAEIVDQATFYVLLAHFASTSQLNKLFELITNVSDFVQKHATDEQKTIKDKQVPPIIADLYVGTRFYKQLSYVAYLTSKMVLTQIEGNLDLDVDFDTAQIQLDTLMQMLKHRFFTANLAQNHMIDQAVESLEKRVAKIIVQLSKVFKEQQIDSEYSFKILSIDTELQRVCDGCGYTDLGKAVSQQIEQLRK